MTLQFENEQQVPMSFDPRTLAEDVINAVLDQESCPYEAELSLTLVEPQEIRRLNREFRKIDRETDVLSFPLVDFSEPAVYDFLEERLDCFHPESGELMLGDIVISVSRASEQASQYGHSLRREVAFLIAHSMLHLLGYDHMNEEEARIMEQKQEQVLTSLGITRDLEA